MNTWIRTLVAGALMLSGVVIAGCGGQGYTASGGDVDLPKGDGVRVTWAEVRTDGNGAVVVGRVMPSGAVTRRHAGHVDVEYVDADGKVVAKASSPTIYLLNRGPGKGLQGKAFRVPVAAAPRAGSTLRVTYHHSPGKCRGYTGTPK